MPWSSQPSRATASLGHSFLITGMIDSKQEKAVLSKLKVFFQEVLAQNGWISNLRNLLFPTSAFVCQLSHIQTFHTSPGALERVLRGEVTSASHSFLTPSWAAAHSAAPVQCLCQSMKGWWLSQVVGGGESWEEWEGGGEKVTKADGSHQSLTTTVGFWEELCHSGWGGDPWAHSMNLNTNPT